jgi:hypothetical protein
MGLWILRYPCGQELSGHLPTARPRRNKLKMHGFCVHPQLAGAASAAFHRDAKCTGRPRYSTARSPMGMAEPVIPVILAFQQPEGTR